jgi:cobalt transporter subunit CbtB
MTESRSTSLPAGSLGIASTGRMAVGAIAIVFGVLLYVGTGFAAPSFIHNATHDTRHAFGLPCH